MRRVGERTGGRAGEEGDVVGRRRERREVYLSSISPPPLSFPFCKANRTSMKWYLVSRNSMESRQVTRMLRSLQQSKCTVM